MTAPVRQATHSDAVARITSDTAPRPPSAGLGETFAREDRVVSRVFRLFCLLVLAATVAAALVPVARTTQGVAVSVDTGRVLLMLPVRVQDDLAIGQRVQLTATQRGNYGRPAVQSQITAVLGLRSRAEVLALSGVELPVEQPVVVVAAVAGSANEFSGSARVHLSRTSVLSLLGPRLWGRSR